MNSCRYIGSTYFGALQAVIIFISDRARLNPACQQTFVSSLKNDAFGSIAADGRIPQLSAPVRRYESTAIAPDESRSTLPLQKIDRPEYVVNHSKALVPANEFPFASSPGAHTQTAISPGSTATIPPPTPLFAGSPTR